MSWWRDWGRRIVAGLVVLGAAGVAMVVLGRDDAARPEAWAFLDDVSLAELGLVAHGPKSGSWGMEADALATGGRALANHEGERGASPAVLVAATPRSRDLRAKTRCRVVGPSVPPDAESSTASCGVVFRFIDAANHWIVRADASASAIEAATVVRGREHVMRRAPIPSGSGPGRWIDLDVEVRGDVVRVAVEGKSVLVAEALAAPAAFGAAGLWAPSESTVFFDHFAIEPLLPTARVQELLPLIGRRAG